MEAHFLAENCRFLRKNGNMGKLGVENGKRRVIAPLLGVVLSCSEIPNSCLDSLERVLKGDEVLF